MSKLPSVDIPALENALQQALTGEVDFSTACRQRYACDASPCRVMPLAVLFPKDAQDCEAIVAVAAQFQVPITPRGAGTGLAGMALGEGLIVDCSRHMRSWRDLDTEAATVIVEPGMVATELNQAIADSGLQFAVDPSTLNRAVIGGLYGNNAWGSHAPYYGSTRDNVLAIELIDGHGERYWLDAQAPPPQLANGLTELVNSQAEAIRSSYPEPCVPNNSGYALDSLLADLEAGRPLNLPAFLAGSEGSLGLVTALKLRLWPQVGECHLYALHYRVLSDALKDIAPLMRTRPRALELLDDQLLALSKGHAEQQSNRFWLQGEPAAVLLLEYEGPPNQAPDCRAYAATPVDNADIPKVWALRRASLGLLMGRPGNRRPISGLEDSSVPLEALPDYIADMQRCFAGAGCEAVYYGSISRGLVHIRPLLDLFDTQDRQHFKDFLLYQAQRVAHYRGSFSCKHGDGRLRAALQSELYPPQIIAAWKAVKTLFDPQGLFNPGSIVDPPRATNDLRPAPKALLSSTELHWPQGFSAAVNRCHGAGACRKKQVGAMCPSYRASGLEQDLTRGRAASLRAVLESDEPIHPAEDPAVQQALSLCLACKSCRRECPAGVDMARLKLEVEAHLFRNGSGLSEGLMRHYGPLSRVMSRFPTLANGLLALKPLKKQLGYAEQAVLPTLQAKSLKRQWPVDTLQANQPTLHLLVDIHSNYYDAEPALALREVADVLGWQIKPLWLQHSPRQLLALGDVEKARSVLQALLPTLEQAVAAGDSITGIEPSEVLLWRDEAQDLFHDSTNRQRIADLAGHIELVEEWLDGQCEQLPKIALNEPRVAIHPHCHQRALAGAQAAQRVMAALGNSAPILETGCCGQAGDFGYRQDSYVLSAEIGKQSIAAIDEEVRVVIADGMSCRTRYRRLLPDTQVVHLAQWVAGCLRGRAGL